MNNIAVIGLGLIGGSFALELKRKTWASIYGIDKNELHVKQAIDLGLILKSIDFEELANMDIVILAVPVSSISQIALTVLNHVGDETLVFDVGSVKAPICDAIRNHPKRHQFVAAHPIAGTEFSGPNAAVYDLFSNKMNIVCEPELTGTKFLKRAYDLFELVEMHTTEMKPKDHDKHIAYVSHLSHISSFMLGKTVLEIEPDEKNIFTMAGSGFQSTVRLAKSSPEMWAPIFLQNKENILQSLNEYIKNLQEYSQLIEEEQFDALYDIMKKTNRIKEVLKGD